MKPQDFFLVDGAFVFNVLEEYFGVSRKKLPGILKNLFDIGVFAKFEVANIDEPYKRYWILNPYVSFKGRLVNSEIAKLFYNTHVERAYAKQFLKEKSYGTVLDIESAVVTR